MAEPLLVEIEVVLPEQLANYVRQQVTSGFYMDAGEVVREALRRQIEAKGWMRPIWRPDEDAAS